MEFEIIESVIEVYESGAIGMCEWVKEKAEWTCIEEMAGNQE